MTGFEEFMAELGEDVSPREKSILEVIRGTRQQVERTLTKDDWKKIWTAVRVTLQRAAGL